ncbi:MAG: GAF domain-containing protein [Bradyrhizobium sp.]
MTETRDNAAPDPQQIIAELKHRLDEARAELAARNSAYSERIAYQAAANDVLSVMSASPGDPQPVFDLIVERARDLCDGYGATVYQFDGTLIHWRAATGVSDDPSARQAVVAMYPMGPTREWPAGRAIIDRQIIHISDLETEPGLSPALRGLTVKSAVLVPIMRGGLPIGVLSLGSRERGGFTDTQIELLKTFAEQAVIAITSAETYRELQQRTRDLTEALQQQTATAEVLKVISRSAFDLQAVLDALLASACRLCEADIGTVRYEDGTHYRLAASYGCKPDWIEHFSGYSTKPDRSSIFGQTIICGRTVHMPDVLADPDYHRPVAQKLIGFRAALGVPLVREGHTFGVITLLRFAVGSFEPKQIEIVETFADQAVIAIENVRLFEQVQAKTRDLEVSLQFQTASAEVLKVISRSPDTLQPVLDVIVETSRELCNALTSVIFLLRDGKFYCVAESSTKPEYIEALRANPISPDQVGSVLARAARKKRTIHVPNTAEDPEAGFGGPISRAGPRALLSVPLIRGGEVIGGITLRQSHLSPFTFRQIEAVESFADQAVIAISNVSLFEQVQQRTRELSKSLDDLRTAQDRLIQTEKLASLGQLTAGIAHEIKNPLNFVNNFSALSAELVEEMKDALSDVNLEKNKREELDEIAQMLKNNLEKVVQHGKRADSIVKNMLLHSREGSGERRSADINALVAESLNLAYHGARAEKAGFGITLRHDFDPNAGSIDLYPQEITRALLNLISNGFYAATRRKVEAEHESFEPFLSAATRDLGKAVEIRIRDNGTGIRPEVREKMFNPFFTTKPTGEGTGLGLSMTHDIVVKQHGGRIDVETEPGSFTEFIITLPRDNSTAVG